jgi:hypothetical protein
LICRSSYTGAPPRAPLQLSVDTNDFSLVLRPSPSGVCSSRAVRPGGSGRAVRMVAMVLQRGRNGAPPGKQKPRSQPSPQAGSAGPLYVGRCGPPVCRVLPSHSRSTGRSFSRRVHATIGRLCVTRRPAGRTVSAVRTVVEPWSFRSVRRWLRAVMRPGVHRPDCLTACARQAVSSRTAGATESASSLRTPPRSCAGPESPRRGPGRPRRPCAGRGR